MPSVVHNFQSSISGAPVVLVTSSSLSLGTLPLCFQIKPCLHQLLSIIDGFNLSQLQWKVKYRFQLFPQLSEYYIVFSLNAEAN